MCNCVGEMAFTDDISVRSNAMFMQICPVWFLYATTFIPHLQTHYFGIRAFRFV